MSLLFMSEIANFTSASGSFSFRIGEMPKFLDEMLSVLSIGVGGFFLRQVTFFKEVVMR